MDDQENCIASELRVGDVFLYQGAWWRVDNNYLHWKSPYAKMNITPYGRPKEIPLAVRLDCNQTVCRMKMDNLIHLKMNNIFDLAASVQRCAKEYSEAMGLSGDVKIPGTSITISAINIQRQAHETLLAEMNKLHQQGKDIYKPHA